MDRLSTLIIVLSALGGACGKGGDNAEPSSRVNAAKVAVKKTDTAAFCDKQTPAERAPAFAAPALASGELAAAAGKWRWINVWATWCKPCIEEMPRLVKWQKTLGFELQFVSVDETEDDVVAYRKLHPETPETRRLAKADAQGAWFESLGLDAAAPIPVHIFVDPSNRVRCVRAGGVRETDLATVKALFASES